MAPDSEREPAKKKRRTKVSGTPQKVWSLEDEVKLLNALLYCRDEYDVDPTTSIDLIHVHIHVHLNMGYSRTQVYEKIRGLKKKFEATVARIRDQKIGPSTERDRALFELSMKVWRPDFAEVLPDVNAEEEGENEVSPQEFPCLEEAVRQIMKEDGGFLGSGFLERGLKLLDPSKLEEFEERWRAYFLEEMKFFMEACELKSELLKIFIEDSDSSGKSVGGGSALK